MDYEEVLARTETELKRRKFRATVVSGKDEARELVLDEVKEVQTVGIGDSATVKQVGVLPFLRERGLDVVNPFRPDATTGEAKREAFVQMMRDTIGTEAYITSANAVTQDGKLLSVDRVGNRIAGTIFGAPKVLLLVGRNKIVADMAEGYARIKNVITPAHSAQKSHRTPCVITGKCCEYNDGKGDFSKDRMCNITVLIEGKPLYTDLHVILINEDLGLGWDPSWPAERISGIKEAYRAATWAFILKK